MRARARSSAFGKKAGRFWADALNGITGQRLRSRAAERLALAVIKAGVGQLEPEQVFPVDAGSDCLGRLPVTQAQLGHRVLLSS